MHDFILDLEINKINSVRKLKWHAIAEQNLDKN